jgi:hypothetical protein
MEISLKTSVSSVASCEKVTVTIEGRLLTEEDALARVVKGREMIDCHDCYYV